MFSHRLTVSYGPVTLATVLLIVILSILDAYFTLMLISLGARELNPIMDFYLNKGPFTFFYVKYFLTCASLFVLLSFKNEFTFLKGKAGVHFLIALFLIIMAAVVQWELYLLDLHLL